MKLNKWDKRFLGLAKHVSEWSKDPSTQVGAVVASDKRVVSVGFNGLPQGVDDSIERLENREVKYSLIIHAEENALLFSGRNLDGCTIYVYPLPPCSRCAGKIIQSGITKVVASVTDDTERWKESFALAKSMFLEAGVEVIEVPKNSITETKDDNTIANTEDYDKC